MALNCDFRLGIYYEASDFEGVEGNQLVELECGYKHIGYVAMCC